MTPEEMAQMLVYWSDQTLVRYFTALECYPSKLVGDNSIIERLVQRGLATGSGEKLSLTDAGKAVLAAMHTEAYNAHPELEAALEVATVDLTHWKRIASWSDSEVVAWIEHIRTVSPRSAATIPASLPGTRRELGNLLETLMAPFESDIYEVGSQ